MTPSIWTGMYHQDPLDQSLRTLHALGWNTFEISSEHLVGIETSAVPESLIEAAQQCAQELNLSMPQAHALLQADVAAADTDVREQTMQRLLRHIEIAARFHVRQIVIHPGGVKSFTEDRRAEIRALNRDQFRRIGDVAGEHQIRIGLENMHTPGYTTARNLLDILESIDHPALGIILDTSHANMSGEDIPEMIHAFGAHLVGTHMSDNFGSRDQHLTPGWGTIDWPAVMQALRAVNYDGIFNLEIPGERHRLPELRRIKTRFAREVTEWLIAAENDE